ETKKDIISNASEIQPYRKLLRFEQVQNPLSSLKKLERKIIGEARTHSPRNVYMYTDIEVNKIVLYTKYENEEINAAFINAIKQYKPVIHFYGGKRPPSPNSSPNSTHTKREIDRQIINGDGIYHLNAGFGCTPGFWVRGDVDEDGDAENDYIVTAGHYKIGSMVYHDIGETDFGLIQITNKDIKPTRKIRNTNSNQYSELHIGDDNPISTHNAHLCKSGLTTFLTCGYTKSFSGFIFNGGAVYDDLIITTMRADVEYIAITVKSENILDGTPGYLILGSFSIKITTIKIVFFVKDDLADK
ncbi:25613_t:CDS:2, partial [Racocetra persica]